MRRRVSCFLKRHSLHWFVITVVGYAAMIPAMVWVFPATTLLNTIVVLFVGFTGSVAALADVLPECEAEE